MTTSGGKKILILKISIDKFHESLSRQVYNVSKSSRAIGMTRTIAHLLLYTSSNTLINLKLLGDIV